jgi:predicted RecB family nuclease
MLYSLVQCPHRLTLDLHEDPSRRDPESKFVELLWERGTAFEEEVMAGLDMPFTDLRDLRADEKERRTLEAIARGDDLIYSGRIRSGDLLGEPDLLKRHGDGYVPGDIKTGAGEEGSTDLEDGKPKKHYAVQLAIYTDILEQLGFSAGRVPFIWDVHGREVTYYLDQPPGRRTPETLWDIYKVCLSLARKIADRRHKTLPACMSTCKLCHWRTLCRRRLEKFDDLTLIPELGRSRRDALIEHVKTVGDLADLDLKPLIMGSKTVIPGVGPGMLKKFRLRARIQKDPDGRPFLKEALRLPTAPVELFFDIEADPMRDICYLHGFVERRQRVNDSERYVCFVAEEPTAEEEMRAFAEAWAYVRSSQPATIFYFSKYERTWWRRLQARFPDVATPAEIETMFDPGTAVDLYCDVVRRHTEWPTTDYSIKTLATFLGFEWRDESPSGAESIEWYHRWVETGDASIRSRILDYNEDDCRALRVLFDAVAGLERIDPEAYGV